MTTRRNADNVASDVRTQPFGSRLPEPSNAASAVDDEPPPSSSSRTQRVESSSEEDGTAAGRRGEPGARPARDGSSREAPQQEPEVSQADVDAMLSKLHRSPLNEPPPPTGSRPAWAPETAKPVRNYAKPARSAAGYAAEADTAFGDEQLPNQSGVSSTGAEYPVGGRSGSVANDDSAPSRSREVPTVITPATERRIAHDRRVRLFKVFALALFGIGIIAAGVAAFQWVSTPSTSVRPPHVTPPTTDTVTTQPVHVEPAPAEPARRMEPTRVVEPPAPIAVTPRNRPVMPPPTSAEPTKSGGLEPPQQQGASHSVKTAEPRPAATVTEPVAPKAEDNYDMPLKERVKR